MNIEQFNGSMARVLAFTQSPKNQAEAEHLNGYMRGLYEAVGDMDAFTFEKVTIELCKNMSRGQRPMPGQFRAIYRRLKEEQRSSQPTKVCGTCKNVLWVTVRMLESKTGLEADFAEPCPECQSRHPLKDAPPKDGWIKVELPRTTHDEEMLMKAKTMGPKGARFVLDMIEKRRVNFHDDVILALIERAGDTPKQENKVAEAVLDKLTVVKEPQTVTVNGEKYEVEE